MSVKKTIRFDIIIIFFLAFGASMAPCLYSFETLDSPVKLIVANILVLVGILFESPSFREYDKGEGGDRGIFIAVVVVLLVLLMAYNRYLKFPPAMPEQTWNHVFGIGVILFTAGVVFRACAMRSLGDSFSYHLGTTGDQQLVRRGVYRIVRHPAYFGTFLLVFGVSLLFGVYTGFFLILCAAPFAFKRIQKEENMLLNRFGKEYEDYSERVKKILPGIL